MDRIRAPFLIAALILSILVLLIELGTALGTVFIPDDPPGIGIPYMAMVDGILVFTLAHMTIGLVAPAELIGRVQGCVTLVTGCLILLAAIVAIFAAITLVLLMIGLIVSFFGAIIYLAVWGDFPRDVAALILATLLVLKIVMAVCLVLAHQRFLTLFGLIALIITSLVLNIVIAFLHDLPPGFLVSVTDAVAAIIVAILAIIWAILLIIGGVIGVLAAIKPPQIGGGEESPQLTMSRTQELQLSVTKTGEEPAAEISKSGT
jgi:hypothetical protein